MGTTNKRVGEKEWLLRVKAWKASGQKQTQWCDANGIDTATFSRWKIKLTSAKSSSSGAQIEVIKKDFLSVGVADDASPVIGRRLANIELERRAVSNLNQDSKTVAVICGRFRAEFSCDIDTEHLRRLLLLISGLE